MSNYQASYEQWVLRLDDSTRIPFRDGHPDYEEYKAWLALGNFPQAPEPRTVDELKIVRAELVNNIKVTTSSGRVFDGDEISQDRMDRAISIMNDTDEIQWILADNTPVFVTKAELQEAKLLSGLEQLSIWPEPYQQGT